jgi:hypothetical protein
MHLSYRVAEELSCPVARALLLRRPVIEERYRISLDGILPLVHKILRNCRLAALDMRVEVALISTAQRACSSIVGSEQSTIVFDLGFCELMADFHVAYSSLSEELNIRKNLVPELAAPFKTQTRAEREIEIDALCRARFGEARVQDFVMPPGREVPPDTLIISHNQVSRDLAAKIAEAHSFSPTEQARFTDLMLSPVEHDGKLYRPGEVLFNYVAAGPRLMNPADLDPGLIFLRTTENCTALMLMHEVAHVVRPRSVAKGWPETARYAELVAKAVELSAEFTSIRRVAAGLDALSRPSSDCEPATAAAAYEAFYDIYALALVVEADMVDRDVYFAHNYLSFIFQFHCQTVSLLIFQKFILNALKEPAMVTFASDKARDEVGRRLCLALAYIVVFFHEHFPHYVREGRLEEWYRGLEVHLDNADWLYQLFHIDVTGSLRTGSAPPHGFLDGAALVRSWTEFLAAVRD